MGSDKIFMFDNPAAGESAGIMSMIPALLQNKGLDPNLVAALMNGNKNQDAWGVLDLDYPALLPVGW